jgi:glycosyltransferase involved in cell wall biosynthesis
MLGMTRSLLGLGARVVFMPDNLTPHQPHTRLLQQLGVEVLYGPIDTNLELGTIGPELSMVILARPHVAGRWMDVLTACAPSATIVYDTVDLHWLRESRRIDGLGDVLSNGQDRVNDTLPAKARVLRELELAMIRAADVSLAITDEEREQIRRDVPGADVRVIPNIHAVEPLVLPPEDRSGILFVGSFEHTPNVDAAVYLAKDIMPRVWRELGSDVRLSIVGATPPPEVLSLASPVVDVLGWVEDLESLLESSRLMLAPLRYGAGMKGKITQSLAAGLPVVTTPIGAEGLGDHVAWETQIEGAPLLVAETPADLAARAVEVYRDADLWRSLSRCGQQLIIERCSPEVVACRLQELLRAHERPGSKATA